MKFLSCAVLLLVTLALFHSSKAEESPSAVNCAACEYLVQSVYDSASNEELIEASGIMDVCGRLQLSKNLCMDAINSLIGPIREVKELGVAQRFACEYVRRCTPKPREFDADGHILPDLSAPLRGELLNGKLCGLCELSVSIIQNYLAASQSQESIKDALLHFCAGLSSPSDGLCALAVQVYLPKIIHSVLNQNLPNQVCTELTMCTLN